ncbi:probable 3-hydroxyisobutyrate dehydrogenase, mitochondrial isoform X4 [Juglans microcarpa x Juglans regia]|uniref:probable 3-hydroxyisobutyrate dehydrogenase, mitochondrial isoform X4 n=1 Tax=Juglans microcarpa x Juglans regia TaxID=2249226 RepID=UPI001B7EBF28|nr:probable 3-hydroxyisobutyrate dehydrogenase, mitochondrial isoform X4 [Juglans microcarpa x Juglans regia]
MIVISCFHRNVLKEITMAMCRARALFSFSKCKPKLFSPLFHFSPIRRFSSSQFESVGFIGLGNMGSRMVHNLIKAGYKVAVHDINCNVLKKFSDMGVSTKETPFEVAEASDVVITMLPSSSHVFDVFTGPNGLLQGGNLLRPLLLIDSSTIDPQTSRKLSVTVSKCILKEKKDHWANPVMLDAPVSGGVLAAEAGTLSFMVGGSEEAYLAAKPLLLSMGKNTIYCGKAGNGSNLNGSDSYNPVPGVMEAAPSSRNYDGGFASKLMAKDLNLAAASAIDVGRKCPLTSQALEIYTEVCQDGHEARDFSCVFRHYYSGMDEF